MNFSIFASEKKPLCLLHGHVSVRERERETERDRERQRERERERERICNKGDEKEDLQNSRPSVSKLYNLNTKATFGIPQS